MIKQGTFEWYYDRFGMITMSERVDVIINGNVHRLNNLLDTIRWERSIKEDVDHVRKEFERELANGEHVASLAWGRKHETEALAQYELINAIEVQRPGFTKHPAWPDLVGSSIDFIEYRGNVTYVGEVKCYQDPQKHLRALRYGMDPSHYNQVQGHIECTQASNVFGKFISYDPRLPLVDQQLYQQVIEPDMQWSLIFRERMTKFAQHLRNGTRFDFEMKGARDGIPSLF